MSAKSSGKRLPSSYWVEQMAAYRKGEITAKELEESSRKYLESIGMIYNDVLGWTKPEELFRAGLSQGQTAIPIRIVTTDKGKRIRINESFLKCMEDRKLENIRLRDNISETDSLVRKVAEELGEIEEVAIEEETPF